MNSASMQDGNIYFPSVQIVSVKAFKDAYEDASQSLFGFVSEV